RRGGASPPFRTHTPRLTPLPPTLEVVLMPSAAVVRGHMSDAERARLHRAKDTILARVGLPGHVPHGTARTPRALHLPADVLPTPRAPSRAGRVWHAVSPQPPGAAPQAPPRLARREGGR